MDRLDTWLNAQRGRRRLVLIGISWYLWAVLLGFSAYAVVSSWASLSGASWTPVPIVAVVAIAVLAVPAAVWSGSMAAAIHAWKARRPNRKKGLPPFFMWRQMVLPLLLVPTEMNATFAVDPGMPISDRKALLLVQVVSCVAIIVLAAEVWRYSRRFTGPIALTNTNTLTE